MRLLKRKQIMKMIKMKSAKTKMPWKRHLWSFIKDSMRVIKRWQMRHLKVRKLY